MPGFTSFPRAGALLVALALAGPALAQADGLWRCEMNGGIPLVTIEISGTAYTLTTVDTSWTPVANPDNGTGTLGIDGNYLWPLDGPLLTSFEVTAALSDDGIYLSLNNDGGALLSCRQ